MRTLLCAALLVVLSGLAQAASFAGFSKDGTRYLSGKTEVCAPLAVRDDGGTESAVPTCETVDKSAVKELAVQRPKKAQKTKDGVASARLLDDKRTVVVVFHDNVEEIVLASWSAPEDLAKVKRLYVGANGNLYAVEYVTAADARAVQVVAFDVTAPRKFQAVDASEVAKKLFAAGDVWTQKLVPCDTAGVKLAVDQKRRFLLQIETKCQGERWVTKLDGKWAGEGDSTLILRFPNEDDAMETMTCTLAACDAGQCLTCGEEDVTFTLQPHQSKKAKKTKK